MIRRSNLVAESMGSSLNVGEFHLSFSKNPDWPNGALDELRNAGGSLSLAPISPTHGKLRFELPHAKADAFGALYLFQQLLGNAVDQGKIAFETLPHLTTGTSGPYSFVHYWEEEQVARDTKASFTQNLLQVLLQNLPFLQAQSIALAVALDDLRSIQEETKWGNSMVFVPSLGAILLAELEQDKITWGQSLRERAARIYKILQKRGATPGKAVASIIVSSCGDLGRLPWAPKIAPSLAALMPTPAHPDSATLFFWSAKGKQGMAFCGSEHHPLYSQLDQIHLFWRELF